MWPRCWRPPCAAVDSIGVPVIPDRWGSHGHNMVITCTPSIGGAKKLRRGIPRSPECKFYPDPQLKCPICSIGSMPAQAPEDQPSQ